MESQAKTKRSAISASRAASKRHHSITIQIRCDLVTAERYPVTLSFVAPPQSPPLALLRLTPHSARATKQCAAFDRGDVMHFEVGGNICRARIARKVDGKILVLAFDVFKALVRPALGDPPFWLPSAR
jgi:hypothetical protein